MDRGCLTEQHRAYWTAKGGGNYEFWRFSDGFLQGWKDAFMFVTFPKGSTSSELGFRGEWLKRRTARHARDTGSSEFLWEFGELSELEQINLPVITNIKHRARLQ